MESSDIPFIPISVDNQLEFPKWYNSFVFFLEKNKNKLTKYAISYMYDTNGSMLKDRRVAHTKT